MQDDTLAHGGPKAYKAEFDLLYRREAARRNEIWQADHTLLDIWLLDEQGKPARPWLTAVVDDYSRLLAQIERIQQINGLHAVTKEAVGEESLLGPKHLIALVAGVVLVLAGAYATWRWRSVRLTICLGNMRIGL